MTTIEQSIQDYLALRRNLGFKLRDAGLCLAKFAVFMEARSAAHITVALALEWAQQSPSMQPATCAQRLGYVRGFARYHVASDPHTEIPPTGLLPFRPSRAQPYLYSEEDIAGLLQCALELPTAGGLRPWTYHCLLGLLSVTGLRIGEAIRLKAEDVDLHAGVLTVRGTKFGKSRLVTIHPSTGDVLEQYRARRESFLAGRTALTFFITSRGNHLDIGDIHRTFYLLSRRLGLRGATASHGPRLHDFRHRFAVQTLLRWYRSGEDVERRMPMLSTYLGHVHVADTYWYLSACPELMGLAVARLEQRWGDLP
ncbi:MAG: tyrosine-type recombinase/integrase [Sulfuritalea sp.]|nr:tyrosine-type recombinase/integrase [Sulfuritalea sp.]